MKFGEAFAALGYKLENVRQDWSAEKSDGVCISLWTKEADWEAMFMDTRIHAGPHDVWGSKLGNRKRARHARRAVDEFDGWIDIVKIDGTPGVSYGNATPWTPSERKQMSWRIVNLDDATGHLRIEAQFRPES